MPLSVDGHKETVGVEADAVPLGASPSAVDINAFSSKTASNVIVSKKLESIFRAAIYRDQR